MEHARPDLEQALDQLADGLGLELTAAADGGRHLTRIDDRAVLEVFLDRPAREDEAHPGEPRRHDEDRQGTEEDELVPDAEAHATARPSPEGDDRVVSAAAVAAAPRTRDVPGDHARDGSTPPNPGQRTLVRLEIEEDVAMWGSRAKLAMPSKDEALPGRTERMPVPAAHFVNGTRCEPPFPRGSSAPCSGWAASGAPSASSGRSPGVFTDGGRLRRPASRRTRRTKRCAAGRPATPRSCSWSSIPSESSLRGAAARSSGRATTRPRACARATTSARSTARRSTCTTTRSSARAEASRDAYQKALAAAGYGAITTEILDAPEFYYAEDYHQQYLAKNPGGYCGLGGTGVACPTGLVEAAR